MARTRSIFFLWLFVTALLQASGANAQNAISPRKRALIRELLEITNAVAMFDDLKLRFLKHAEQTYPQLLLDSLEKAGLLNKIDREMLTAEFNQSFRRFSRKYNELMSKRVNAKKAVDQVSYPLYDKYYDEDDLRAIIEFYRTPTGRKVVMTLPELTQESVQRWSQLLNPVISDVIGIILEEEKKRVALEIAKREKQKARDRAMRPKGEQ